MAISPNAPISSAEAMLSQRTTRGVSRARRHGDGAGERRPPRDRAREHAEHDAHRPAAPPAPAPRLANSAAKNRMVAGLVSGEGDHRCPRAGRRVEAAALRARRRDVRRGEGVTQRADGDDDEHRPADEPERTVDADEELGDGGQAERGDGAVLGIGGGDAEAGHESVAPAALDGAADDEEADRARGRRRSRTRWRGHAGTGRTTRIAPNMQTPRRSPGRVDHRAAPDGRPRITRPAAGGSAAR